MNEKNLEANSFDVDLDVGSPGFSPPQLSPSRPPPAAAPAAPAAVEAGEPSPLTAAQAQELIAAYEREAKALGTDPGAARLFHAMGLLWEEVLKNQRNAAVCYQNAYKLAPRFLANLESARRLFAAVGNWPMVAQLIEAQASAVEVEAHQLSLMLEKAAILETRLGKADEALKLLESLAQRAPGSVPVLLALESARVARGDFAGQAQVEVALAQAASGDAALAAGALMSAARLFEGKLNDPKRAAELVRQAFALRKDDPAVLSALQGLAEREGNAETLLEVLLAQAELAGERSAPLWLRASKLLERMGRGADAVQALLKGRQVAPRDPLLLDELARCLEASGNFAELADVLHARLEGLTDQSELISLNLRLGALYEERLGEQQKAIGCFRAVLERSPGQSVALASLGRLCARNQDWLGVVQVYQAEIAANDDPRQKAARLYKVAEILENRLERVEEAVAVYAQALSTQPDYLPAQKALQRLYERQAKWDALIALFEQDLAQTRDRDQAIAVLTRVADLHEERRQDQAAAAATLRRILEMAPDHLPTIRSLSRLLERLGMWEELIRNNELEASLVNDAKQVLSLLHSNAEIYDEKLKLKEQAIESYTKVLSLAANYLPALKALGRLYAQDGRWEEMVTMYRQEAEITPATDQAALLIFKAGELLEQKLNRVDDAIAGYQEVLTLAPDHFPAMQALSRIYRSQKAFESLVEILRAEAAARAGKVERANTLYQVGSIWDEDLNRPEMAAEAFQEALGYQPDHAPSLRALERLYLRQGQQRELASMLEAEIQSIAEPRGRIPALEKLSALFADRLADPAAEEHCLEQLLAIDPAHLWALSRLAQLRASDRPRRGELLAREAAVVKEPQASVALLLAGLRESDKAPAAEPLRRAAEMLPEDPRVQAEYERALKAAGDYAGLSAWIESRLSREQGPEPRQVLLMQFGEVCEWQLGRFDRALGAYRAVLEAAPSHLPALRAARRVLSRAGAHREVYKLLLAEGQSAKDPQTATDAMLEAGRIAEEVLKDDAAARGAYQAILARNPLEERAAQRLEGLLAQSGGAGDMAALHLKRARTRAASGDAQGSAEELFTAAKLFASTLKDLAQAREVIDQALTQAPSHAGAHKLRAELCLSQGQFAEAARSLAARLDLGGEPAEIGALRYQLGVLLQEKLNDPASATAHLQTAYNADPRNLDALERLGAIHLAARNWSGAADAYRRLVEAEKKPDRQARFLCTYAQIAEEGFNELQAAADHYRKAMELAPNDGTILDRLAAVYEKLGNLPELAELIERQATAAGNGADKPRAIAQRLKAGELFARLHDTQKAAQMYRFAVEMAPDNVQARAALAELLTKEGPSAAAMEEQRKLLALDPFRLEAYHALYKMYAHTKQMDRAVCVGHVLGFFRALTEAEAAQFAEARGRAPTETAEALNDGEMDTLLVHPLGRSVLSDLMRILGDQLHKVFEPGLDAQGIGRGDRLKSDHAIYKLAKAALAVFGVEKFEVYQGKKGAAVTLENTDPLSMVVGPDFVRRYNQREQKYVMARAAWHLRNKMALAQKLDQAKLADLFGNAVRAVMPEFDRMGKPDPELSKRIKKAMSGKAVRALEVLAPELAKAKSLDLVHWVQSTAWSGDRAGLLLAGDLGASLQLVFREDNSVSGTRMDTSDQIVNAAKRRREMAELLIFVLSDDHFRLRSRLRLAVG